jgi:hypothetical protein
LIGPVCDIAALPLTWERKNLEPDDVLDALIGAARMFKQREGFAVITRKL